MIIHSQFGDLLKENLLKFCFHKKEHVCLFWNSKAITIIHTQYSASKQKSFFSVVLSTKHLYLLKNETHPLGHNPFRGTFVCSWGLKWNIVHHRPSPGITGLHFCGLVCRSCNRRSNNGEEGARSCRSRSSNSRRTGMSFRTGWRGTMHRKVGSTVIPSNVKATENL